MEVEKIKKQSANYTMAVLKTRHLRVAAYARVSTLREDQKNSFNQQQNYYMKKIYDNPNWIFVNVYTDEGITGTKVMSRTGFQDMVKDVVKGKIDLVLTKSISRFARNTVDVLNYVRLFKECNCGIYFEEENINTLDMNGELLLTILGSIAQQESENISSHVRLGLEMKMKRGEIIGCGACYGYRYDIETKQIYIIPEEAEVVKKIFNMYLNNYSSREIAIYLNKNHIKTKKNLYNWRDTIVQTILKNEKYVGDLLLGKNYTYNGNKKYGRKNTGQRDMYYVKDHHEPIVSRDVFDKAQEIRKSRIRKAVNKNVKSYSKYIVCGFCNSKGNKTHALKKCNYVCSAKLEGKCDKARYIPEDLIFKLFIELVNRLNDYLHNRIVTADDYDLVYLRNVVSKYLLDKRLKKFDDNLFDELIRFIIIGEDNNPYKIRFILRSQKKYDDFIQEKNLDLKTTHFLILFQYNYNYELKTFVKDSNNIRKEEFINKFKISIEVVNEDDNGSKGN